MSDEQRAREEEVFEQEVSVEDLDVAVGGVSSDDKDSDTENCIKSQNRFIYKGGFPNCAATVEDGSWCDTNDACKLMAVDYQDMRYCLKAWS